MSPRRTARLVDLAGALAATGWITATALSQHPNRAFDRMRKYDRTGVAIPNWRFFAPEPATHDFRVLHRYVTADGTTSDWEETNVIAARRWHQAVWFPERRRDKAMTDLCNEIIGHLNTPGVDLTVTTAYRLLRDFVATELAARVDGERGDRAPRGFQFLVASDCGYDEDSDPQYLFASRYEPWTGRAA